MPRNEMTQSLEIKHPNFQKDIIIPEIYNLQNIKLIQSCNYPQSPVNKVTAIKKKHIESIIKGIINKPRIHSAQPKRHKVKPKKTDFDDKSYKQIYQKKGEQQKLFMGLDEQIGEMISLMEQNFAPTSERIQNVLSKVTKYIKNKEKQQNQKKVEKYLTFRSVSKIREIPRRMKRQPKGLIQQLQKIKKYGIHGRMKRRVQSAKVIGSTPQSQNFMLRQTTSRLIQRSTSNLNEKRKYSEQIAKSKQLITMINNCLAEEEKTKSTFTKNFSQMKEEWGETSKLQKTIFGYKNSAISYDALSILRQKRVKEQAVERLDKQILRK